MFRPISARTTAPVALRPNTMFLRSRRPTLETMRWSDVSACTMSKASRQPRAKDRLSDHRHPVIRLG